MTATDLYDGGFSAEIIAERWSRVFSERLETVGEEFPAEVLAR